MIGFQMLMEASLVFGKRQAFFYLLIKTTDSIVSTDVGVNSRGPRQIARREELADLLKSGLR